MAMHKADNLKRKRITYKDKITILKKIEEGISRDDILKTYEISKSCFYEIMKKKDDILILNKEEFRSKKNKRSPNDRTLEECLLTWFLQAREVGQSISGPILQAKALELNNLLNGPSNFKVSKDRYLYIYIKLHITYKIIY